MNVILMARGLNMGMDGAVIADFSGTGRGRGRGRGRGGVGSTFKLEDAMRCVERVVQKHAKSRNE
jgi:hypothetical protein